MLPPALGNDRADHLDQREHHGPSKNTPTVVPASSNVTQPTSATPVVTA
jgi:hypothetical protein